VALKAVVRVGQSNKRAFLTAHGMLDAAAVDPRIPALLAGIWLDGEQGAEPPLVISVLTSPAKRPTAGTPSIHLTEVVSIEEWRLPQRDRFLFYRAHDRLPRMMIDLITRSPTPPVEVTRFLQETDSPAFLNALARAWTISACGDGPPAALTAVVRANANLPRSRPPRESSDILIAIMKGCDDVVDELLRSNHTVRSAVKTLVDGLGAATGTIADDCQRVLRGLTDPMAIDSLRSQVMNDRRNDYAGIRLLVEMGWHRSDEKRFLFALLLHGDLDVIAAADPHGTSLRAMYHAESFDGKKSIRRFMQWLAAELAKPVEERSAAGAPYVNSLPPSFALSPQARRLVNRLSAVLAADDVDWRRQVAAEEERRRRQQSWDHSVPSCG
jgi:hypothetical protein